MVSYAYPSLTHPPARPPTHNQVLSRKHHQVFMIQILRGVGFLHKNGIIHRDLKPGQTRFRAGGEAHSHDACIRKTSIGTGGG